MPFLDLLALGDERTTPLDVWDTSLPSPFFPIFKDPT